MADVLSDLRAEQPVLPGLSAAWTVPSGVPSAESTRAEPPSDELGRTVPGGGGAHEPRHIRPISAIRPSAIFEWRKALRESRPHRLRLDGRPIRLGAHAATGFGNEPLLKLERVREGRAGVVHGLDGGEPGVEAGLDEDRG